MAFYYLKRNFISPILEFIHDSRAVGIIILCCSAFSLLITNSPLGAYYTEFIASEWHISDLLPHSLLHWINDGLMTLFFLLAGMEIKRELINGELSSLKKSILPVMGALGGMVLPALIFMMFNAGGEGASGWGIPMATDIAFSLGVASLLGERVPLSLKIFLTALAIIDDLGAIIAIAVFYTTSLKLTYLAGGLILFGLQALWVKFKKPFGWWNILTGLLLWFLIFNSGIHATIAGVLFAFTIPSAQLVKWENKLHHSVNFLIIPFFVLFNTAILIPSSFVDDLGSPLSLGIISGLILGKPLGIVLFCWLTVKLKWGELSGSISWKQLGGLGILASIGFTMSIFISLLAFNELGLQNVSKTAVMTASILAILFSFIWFKWIVNPKEQLKEKTLDI